MFSSLGVPTNCVLACLSEAGSRRRQSLRDKNFPRPDASPKPFVWANRQTPSSLKLDRCPKREVIVYDYAYALEPVLARMADKRQGGVSGAGIRSL